MIGPITIGHGASVDVDVLLATRMLIQANSGGGKSWMLRRLAEQLFGKVPVIIIDPEGEFATLREKYGYVLVGKGGETPADVRTASLVAHKLLELHASAVCDLYEMKPYDRHRWVKAFLDAMIDSPKSLWHPVVVVVDEAHVFCPEKGAGESEASDSMISLATRGRKRGFCPVFATQRLGKLRKDAAAELLNVMVGPTFMDIDRKRAAECMGVPGSDMADFFQELKTMDPGTFFMLGRAISKDRIRVKVGGVSTTHPQAGSVQHSMTAPPTPEKVKKLLPSLADLPKVAEQKAQTEAELRAEVRRLTGELQAARLEKPHTETKTVEVPVLTKEERDLLECVKDGFGHLQSDITRNAEAFACSWGEPIKEILTRLLSVTQKQPAWDRSVVARPEVVEAQRRHTGAFRSTIDNIPPPDSGLTGPEQRILNALAWLETIGNVEPEQTAVAFLAGYTIGGGAWNNPRGALRTKGLIDYRGDRLVLTDDGRKLAVAPSAPLTADELQRMVIDRLPGPESKLLAVLINTYPRPITNEDLAELAGYQAGCGAFNNPRGRLRSLGLIDYPARGQVVARPLLFLQ